MRMRNPVTKPTSMIRQLWQRLVIWFGLRYDKWPPWWHDVDDVTWTSVTGHTDGRLWIDEVVVPNAILYSGPAVVPKVPLDGIGRLRKRLCK